ncbi:MAG: type II toxin-antitoxin system HipA family toxin [Betaproteobacteria bacterium]|nr:type II toxin-antitoxin system HipA family toxin [Betaproteobacteria bacterium]
MAAQTKKPDDVVEAVIDLERLRGPHRMGWLHRQASAGGDVFSFEYDKAWLKHPDAFTFDPDLQLVEGRTYAPAGRENFGIFLDSSPDRWGRLLMQRRAAHRAAKQGKPAPTLTAWDYLLGVHDITRLGALRFRRSRGTPFLDDDALQAAPPVTSVRGLQAVSLRLEEEHAEEHPDYEKWLAQLVAPGSSLGGARPKAAVMDEQGRFCIAKFPSRRDTHDVGAWETVVHRLAGKAGIEVAEARPLAMGDEGHTFLVRRFDRSETGGRRAYVSAMTLLQRQDGEPGASYLEMVELLQSRGARTRADCAQLFRRVVFNILVSNTDDHLRNHGFFMEPQGLVLSPAFDMNPNPERSELSLAIDEANATCDVEVALKTAGSYGLTAQQAADIVEEVRASVATWRGEASKLDISRAEQERLSAAFR